MNAKEYLSQIRKYDRMINNKLADIYRLKQLACSVSIEPKQDSVQTSRSYDKMGDSITKIVDMENEVNELIDDLFEKKRVIVSQIDEMEDDFRDVLTARFVLCMTFDDIPEMVSMSRRKVFYTYEKALKAFEEKYLL